MKRVRLSAPLGMLGRYRICLCTRGILYLLAVSLLMASGCSTQRKPAAPASESASLALCVDNRGTWNQANNVCTRTVTNAKNVDVKISAKYPDDLLRDPAAGPPLKDFVNRFFDRFGRPDDGLARSGRATLTYETFEHDPNVESIVFTNFWDLGGAHGNDEITTFTFDVRSDKVLSLADLFCAGIDPLIALPPLARPYVQGTVGQNADLTMYEPGRPTGYADDYRAWYLDGPDLVLVMPAARNGPAIAGQWKTHIPLSQLHSSLIDGGCKA